MMIATSTAVQGGAGAYSMTIAGSLSGAIGAHGLPPAVLESELARLRPHLDALRDEATSGRLPLLAIVRETADLAEAKAALDRLIVGARTLVFFGTGGSSLGGQTLAQLGGWNIPGVADQAQHRRPRTRFYDNLDPDTLALALGSLDLASTRFVVTSKSGNTPETLVQAMAAIGAVRARGLEARLPGLFLGLTEAYRPGVTNGLRALCDAHGIPTLEHHAGIGGRYSVLSNVGLLPALARGLDPAALRAGAARVVDELLGMRNPADYAPAVGAALSCALARERGTTVQVMMPYADRLGRFAHWFVQLWAESLGKGGNGTTPIACLGPLDHHSQLQLFMDGPRMHLTTVLRVATAGRGPCIDPALAATARLDVIAGRTVGDLVAAQSTGVPDALTEAGRPVRAFDMARLDEATMGSLLMHFMIETILAGRLFSINPFDQPAVERGKVLARERLERGA
jgi:glucose-6-phosphate isomerase